MQQSEELSDAQLAEVNSRLGEIVNENGWTRTMAIGQVIVDRLFQGRIGPPQHQRKHPSLRQLAARPDCPLRKTALAEALAVFALVNEEPELRALPNLSPSHVAAVLCLEPDVRRQLLEHAAQGRWTVRSLTERTKNIRALAGSRRVSDGPAQGKRALTLYHSGTKCLREGLRALLATKNIERNTTLQFYALARELALLLHQTSDALRLVASARADDAPTQATLEEASAM